MRHHDPASSIPLSASKLLPKTDVVRVRSSVRPAGFTNTSIRRMDCPSGSAEKFFWDANCPGFGLRALKSGHRSWIYQYRDEHRRTRRIVLGDASLVSLDAARKAARQHAARIVHGANPSAERKAKRSAVSLLDVVDAYLEEAKTRQRPRSFKETERHLRLHASALHHDRAEAIRRREIAALLERIKKNSGPIAANRLRAALSAMWSWGLRTGRIDGDDNPVSFTICQTETPRDRVLSDSEIREIWKATEGDRDYARIVRLCLLTGCRREEIGGLRWAEVQANWLVIATGRMKGNSPHEVPLLPMIASALPRSPRAAQGFVFGKRGSGFSGWSKSKKALDAKLAKAMEMPSCGLHDLRRTLSTRLHDAGVAPLVVEALLAHKQQGVAAVYNRASFRDAKRVALTRWHEILTGISEVT